MTIISIQTFCFSQITLSNIKIIPDTLSHFDTTSYIPPIYLGGLDSLNAFAKRNINLPKDDFFHSRTVLIQFTVDTDGVVKNFKFIRFLGDSVDEEVIRVLRMMPKWKPGHDKNNKPIKTDLLMPIYVKIE